MAEAEAFYGLKSSNCNCYRHTITMSQLLLVALVCSAALHDNNNVGTTSSSATVDAFAPTRHTFSRYSPLLFEERKLSSFHHNMSNIFQSKLHHGMYSGKSSDGDVDNIVDSETKQTHDTNSSPSQLKSDNCNNTMDTFDSIVAKRYACTRFQRYKEPTNNIDAECSTTTNTTPQAAISEQSVVKAARDCLELSQRAPSGFNAQPYRVILVYSKEDKERLSQYCLGRNADRVRDSDCTAVFVADRECGRDGERYTNFLLENMDPPLPSIDDAMPKESTSRTRRPLSSKALFKLRMLIILFSSGYPLPRFINVPFSWGVRTAVSILAFIARCLHSLRQRFRILQKLVTTEVQLLPTLSSSQTWAQKNTMLAAMIYMLACTSRGLATCPMEGIDAAGVRKVLGIPRGRYSIPLIVCAGTPYRRSVNEVPETDDVGMSHGDDGDFSPRYKLDEVVFGNTFGKPCELK